MNDLSGLVEEEILDELAQYTVNKTQKLTLTHNRFDLAIKLYFLEGLSSPHYSSYRNNCYKQHIKSFSDGTFSEPNNSEKNSYEEFERVFKSLHNDIKENGFNSEKSLIPLAIDGSILNGAHRASATIFSQQTAGVINTQLPARNFDYKYFKDRGMPTDMLDIAAKTYIEYDENCFLAIVWPAAKGRDEAIENILSKVVYKKNVKLNYNGAHNLLVEAYKDEPWLGPKEKNFPGIKNKLVGCFPNFDDIRVYIFKADNLDEVLVLKDKVRDLFGIEKHAIHITDNKEETLRIGGLLLNNNGVHFLNYAFPQKFLGLQLNKIPELLSSKSLDVKKVIFDESMVLDIYGLRKNIDITFRMNPNIQDHLFVNAWPLNEFYLTEEVELFNNPKFHFYFKGFKFISLKEVYRMKKRRLSEQDLKDIKLIKQLMKSSIFREKLDVVRCSFYFKKIMFIAKIKQCLAKIFIRIGLYNLIKKLLGSS
jgi:hypothetical protein